MIEKEKFCKEVEKLKSSLIHGACSSQIAMETRCKEEAYNEVLAILDSMQEKPVSKNYRERYKRIAQSEKFKKIYEGMSVGEIMHVEGEEPVSEDLGDYINELSKQFPEVSFAKLSRIAVRVAKWQKEQDQSTIELAEDHAYFAGRTKTIEEIEEKLLSEVLPCFMHGGEADEVVAKLDEVLNQKK